MVVLSKKTTVFLRAPRATCLRQKPWSVPYFSPLRTLRLIHYAAWIAQRWHDPAFPHAFSWFDSPRYWQDHILNLREQIALMDEPPLIQAG
ncbi:hypothetical protein [Denitromonas ohlonensis]|uniref:hypothetical protein n=1 Tax=Denitromonas ohlonensis TaxID=3078508 RepID=UPI0037042AA4